MLNNVFNELIDARMKKKKSHWMLILHLKGSFGIRCVKKKKKKKPKKKEPYHQSEIKKQNVKSKRHFFPNPNG